MPYISLEESARLYYYVKGTGLPIVFIHPPVMGHKVFKHQEKLAKDYQTVFYDLRGHGLSSKGETILSIGLLANDLKKLLDHLGIKQAVICGFSNGGTVAQEFALLYPERTRALILCGGYAKVDSFILKNMLKTGMALSKLQFIPFTAKILAKSHKFFSQDEREFYHYSKKADPKSVFEFCRAGLHYDATPSLYRLVMPVLLVYGSLEKTMHHYRKPFQASVLSVEVVYISNASHEVPPRHFPVFNETVHQFLQSSLNNSN